MNRDDIIRMAREAGGDDWGIFRDFMPEIERFANLVAATEREAVIETIDVLFGMESDRNNMFSDGYDYALYQIKEFVLGRRER